MLLDGEVCELDDGGSSTWRCSVCTLINDWSSAQCATCDTPWLADRRRHRSPQPSTAATHRPQRAPVAAAAVPQFTPGRAPSPGKIIGTMNQATQTDAGSVALQSAQKVFFVLSLRLFLVCILVIWSCICVFFAVGHYNRLICLAATLLFRLSCCVVRRNHFCGANDFA